MVFGMDLTELSLGLLAVLTALGAATGTQWYLGQPAQARRVTWTPLDEMGDRCVFLFEDDRLVDATPEARALLGAGEDTLEAWPRLCSVLEPRFPGCASALSDLGIHQRVILNSAAKDDTSELEAEWRGGLTRIVLSDAPGARPPQGIDTFGLQALSDELDTLRKAVNGAPIPMWKTSADGSVRWADAAYLELAQRLDPARDSLVWPLPTLFPDRPAETVGAHRVCLTPKGTETEVWFECYAAAAGSETFHFALPADTLVRTEASLREFVQTLTKTFAHLTTGLAVFDRDRRLALFNPALTDLSALEPQFLSSRPTLFEFLDQLRNRQRMPEPKDYKSWRKRIGDLEAAATSGTHIETWSLPTGQTYRVTGRPHPDGAVAFLFEDISAEVSATRRFRTEMELGQSVLDTLPQAIAVFSANGSLEMSNTAYEQLWQHDGVTRLDEIGLDEASKVWEAQCGPSPLWDAMRDAVRKSHNRQPWSGRLRHLDGRRLTVRAAPLAGHATLVSFEILAQSPRRPRPRHRNEPDRAHAEVELDAD